MDRCLYCQSGHSTTLCNRLLAMSLEERVAVANKLRLCFHCTSTGHNAKNCPDKKTVTCSTCNRKGHIALFHGRPSIPPNGSSDQQRRNGNNNVGFEPKIVNPLMPQEEKDAAASSSAKDGEDTENPPI